MSSLSARQNFYTLLRLLELFQCGAISGVSRDFEGGRTVSYLEVLPYTDEFVSDKFLATLQFSKLYQ